MNDLGINLMLRCVVCAALLIGFTLNSTGSSFGQDVGAELWPDKVDAIVLLDEHEFRVRGPDRAKYKVHRIIQVYNERGKEYGWVVIGEHKFQSCTKVKGWIKDLEGNVLSELEDKEIYKAHWSPDYVLYNDNKFQGFKLSWSHFPYIVEYVYELDIKSLFFWPHWDPQEKIPVMNSTYLLTMEGNVGFKTHAIGLPNKPFVREESGRTVYLWKMEKIAPKIEEPLMPPEKRNQKLLKFAPAEFKMDQYHGSFATWDLLANWYERLYSGKYILPEEAKKEVISLLSNTSDEREKIQKLYSFLQDHTRYVAISLGIGGWEPFSARTVFSNQYGDCKALSAFMISMLREVGFNAYPAMIKTRDNGIVIKEFPSHQFNHVITCVPLQKDTVWLECTSDYLFAGDLPYQDEGCDVLLVSEDGGRIVRTPQSYSRDNRWIGKVTGSLTKDGNLNISGTITVSGNKANWMRNSIHDEKDQDQEEWIVRRISRYVPKFTLSTYKITNLEENYGQPVILGFEGKVTRFNPPSRKRIFINPNILHRKTAEDIPKEDERNFPIHYNYAFLNEDSVIISIPDGYVLENAPKPIEIEAPFGLFRTSYTFTNSTLRYYRTMRIDRNQFPSSLYEDYLSFIKAAVNNDKSNFVFRYET